MQIIEYQDRYEEMIDVSNCYDNAKKIYKQWYHSVKMMPENVKEEFNAFNVPDRIIKKWRNEYVEGLYSETLSYLCSNSSIDDYDNRYFAKLQIIFKEFPKDKINCYRLIELFEKFHEKGFFSLEMKKNDVKYDYLFKYNIICNKDVLSQDIINELYLCSKNKYCGFLEFLFRNNYIDLYNRLMSIIYDSIKEVGDYFQYFIVDLLGYLNFINDENKIKEISKIIDINI